MLTMNQIATRIIKEQELVVGPIAWIEARKVPGLRVINAKEGEVELNNGDPKEVVDRLVTQYENLFGRASHQVCIEAVSNIVSELPPSEIPSTLRA